MLVMRETFVNETKGYQFGESEWYEPYTDNRGRIFRDCQSGRAIAPYPHPYHKEQNTVTALWYRYHTDGRRQYVVRIVATPNGYQWSVARHLRRLVNPRARIYGFRLNNWYGGTAPTLLLAARAADACLRAKCGITLRATTRPA